MLAAPIILASIVVIGNAIKEWIYKVVHDEPKTNKE